MLHGKWATAALILILAETSAQCGEADWKVGLAQVKVTPEQPMLMSGYGGRTKPFTKVAADLYVKALVLEDRKGYRGVLVTSDLLGFPASVAEPICERIQKKLGLKRSTRSSLSKKVRQKSVKTNLRSLKLTFSPIHRPSHWWNMGEWVASLSTR